MLIKAAVQRDFNLPWKIEELELDEPKEGEVLVKLVASAVCHTDLHLFKGDLPHPLPCVPGHEGAGIVEKIGPGVTSVKPGDHIVIWMCPYCGRCRACLNGKPYWCEQSAVLLLSGTMLDGTTRLRTKEGESIFHFFCDSSFAEYAVVLEKVAIKIRDDIPLEKACLFGCGASTGIGAVLNHAKVKPGESVAIFGCGGVGLSALMAANLSGAYPIIAVDVLDSKLEIAKELGATYTINAKREDPLHRILSLTGGVDYAFEAIGKVEVISILPDCIRSGGLGIVIGAAPYGSSISIDAGYFLFGKTLAGNLGGMTNPHIDIPKWLNLFMAGKLPIDKLITRTFSLDEINSALEALEKGKVLRSVILL